MYRQTSKLPDRGKLTCPECKSTMFRLNYKGAECTNCGWSVSGGNNKYGAKRTVANDGIKRDSKYEATVADELLLRKKAGDILDYESQFKVVMPIYNEHGRKVHEVSHKVDFRIQHRDGSFELLEAKGVETSDYKFRRKLLEKLWLPENLDHTYTVVKQNKRKKY